jgi:hypothetical protein
MNRNSNKRVVPQVHENAGKNTLIHIYLSKDSKGIFAYKHQFGNKSKMIG